MVIYYNLAVKICGIEPQNKLWCILKNAAYLSTKTNLCW